MYLSNIISNHRRAEAVIKTNEMDYRRIIDEISRDVDMGAYDNFEKLKNELICIRKKMCRTLYVVNAEQLSEHDLRVLNENGY